MTSAQKCSLSAWNADIRFQIEDQAVGQFAFIAYTHPQMYDFRYLSEGREELYNKGDGRPMVAIHLWPGNNRIANRVIWPMVEDFEARGMQGSSNSRYSSMEESLERRVGTPE